MTGKALNLVVKIRVYIFWCCVDVQYVFLCVCVFFCVFFFFFFFFFS